MNTTTRTPIQQTVASADDHAAVPFFPPVLPLGAFATGLLLEFTLPLNLANVWPVLLWRLMLAAVFVVPGAVIFVGSGRALRRAQTNVNPRLPTTNLVEAWPFSISRNPMYFGGNLLYLGLGIAFHLAWVLLLFPGPALLCHFLVVKREEAYLVRKFGAEYRDYCRRVRRWI